MRYLHMWFRENLGLKVVSVLIAVLLWSFVMVRENPAVVREVQVPITARAMRNVPEGLTVLEYSPQTAKVIISGLRRVVESVQPGQLSLVADLSGRGPGERVAALSLEEVPPGLTVESIDPQTVRVVLDRIVSEVRPVQVRLKGEPAPGFVLGEPQPAETQVRVTGAAGLVAKVDRVVAEGEVANLSGSTEISARVQAVDAEGRALPQLTVDPARISVVIPVSKSTPATKTVPVEADLVGPAQGYEVISTTVNPDKVTLTGSPQALAQVSVARTEQVRLGASEGRRTYRVGLVLPSGVKPVEARPLEVTVSVRKRPASSPQGEAGDESGPGLAPVPGSKAAGSSPDAEVTEPGETGSAPGTGNQPP